MKNEMGGACSTYGAKGGTYRVLVVKPDGQRPLDSPRRRWEYNIKLDLPRSVMGVGVGGCMH